VTRLRADRGKQSCIHDIGSYVAGGNQDAVPALADQETMVFALAEAATLNIDCVSALSFGPCIAVVPLYP
jgi:hypothetical protein